MSSRFGPPAESRYPPRERDRSPPTRFERRGANQHQPPILPRNNDTSYRSSDSSTALGNPRDGPRDPPRGPRISHDGPRGGSYAPRGRGYGPRESRDSQFPRRESDRDWQRRDTFDRRSPPAPRNRSRTPPGKDYRDSRDSRDPPGRDLDLSRVTRNVRETGPLSATSTHSDSPFSGGGYFRGNSFRGRGRGDWEGRGRGRGFVEDRDGFRQRSRSRDRINRDFRDERSREYDRDLSRRDEDKKPEWDRDTDRYRKDPPLRPESRNSTGSHNNSASPSISSAPFKDNRTGGFFQDGGRRSSFVLPQTRPEMSRNTSTPQPPSSPMQSVQVPMFGTFNPSATAPTSKPFTAQTSPKEASPNPGRSDPLKVAPKAPKADLNALPPTGPKAAASFQRRAPFPLNSPVRGYDAQHHESPVGQSPGTSRFSGPSTPSSAPHSTGPPRIRAFAPWGSPELGSRPSPSEAPTSMQRFQGHDMPLAPPTSVNTSPRIPTGPKASQPSIRASMIPRGSKLGAMTWVNPRLQRPSILQPLAHNAARKDDESAARPSTSSSNREMSRKTSRTLSVGNDPSAGNLAGLKQGFLDVRSDKQETQAPSETTSTRAATPEDEDAVDDDLDQEDFDEQERQFMREMDAWRSKKAPPPTENPTLLVLLDELDALASAAEDLENGVLPPPKVEEPSTTMAPAAMPTPPNDATGIKKSDEPMEFKLEGGTELVDLPLEGLPHLINGIPTPISEVDFVDIKDCEEELCQRIRETLAVESQTDEELRQEFARLYRDWREEVDALDEEKREFEEATEEKRVPTPLPELPPEPAPLPAAQNEPVGRRALFASEEEINKIMNDTKVESDMKTMQRTQDAQERADPNREAPIPDMLTLEQQKVYLFEDVNNFVNASSVLQTFGFVPPSDNFNVVEQDSFKEAYVATPKKWGHIAQAVNEAKFEVHMNNGYEDKFRPRDFHDCIRHYYLTKKECVYKSLQTRRGRKRRGALKPRRGANTIMGSGPLAEDMGPSPNKVTETGRPKRAAAPNFNDKEKKEGESVSGRGGSGVSRRGGAGSTASTRPSGAAGESAQDKPTARRGRQPNKDKGAKRGGSKPTILAPHISPVKKAVDTDVTMTDAPPNDGIQARHLETAEVLARFSAASTSSQQQTPALITQKSPPESWRSEPKVPLSAPMQSQPGLPQQIQSASDSLLGMRVTLAPGPQVPPAHLQGQPQLSSTASTHIPVSIPAVVPPVPLQQPQPLISASQVPPSLSQSTAPPLIDAIPAKLGPGGRNAATSSYWSVQEQQDFDALIRHYGRNWEAVGKEMPAKTETMVKNHFMRQITQQNREDLKQWADDADQRNKGNAPSGPLLDPTRTIATATGAGNPGRRRGQTVNNSSQRILAPNPDQVQETAISAASDLPQSSSTISSQVSPQDRGHARLAIAPQRQPIAPSSSVVEQSSIENPGLLGRYQDAVQPTHPVLPTHKEKLQVQTPQSQPTIHQAQQPFQVTQASRFASDLPREAGPPSIQPSAKRPRSQTEQELMDREQPPKRQGVVTFDQFASNLAQQHEQQHLQRIAARSEQHLPYDYKAPKQQPPQPQQQQPQQHGQLPSMPRTGSNPEEVDRVSRVRPIQPSVSPREHRRDSFGGGHQYHQLSLQPNIQPHVHAAAQPMNPQTAMQAAMQGRPMIGSPAQRTPPDISRPSSVPAPPIAQPPSRPTAQAPAKRSNLMSLLNDEPSEPPPRTSSTEGRPAPPPPQRRASPLTQIPMYQTPSQPASSYSRRDIIMDPVREVHQGHSSRLAYSQPAYGSPAGHSLNYREPSQQQQQQSYSSHQHAHQQPPTYQPQHQHQNQHQHQHSQPKENLGWPTSRSSYYNEPVRPPVEPPRPVYQQHPPSAASPPPQPPTGPGHSSSSAYAIPSARSSAYHSSQHQPSQQPQQLDGPSHTPHPHSHSRASSFTGPGQALAPSPYASIRPTSTLGSSLQSHGPPQPLSPQLPSYYGPSLGHGPGHGPGHGGGRNGFAGLGGEHEGMRSAHAEPSRGGGMMREEVLGGHAPRRYTPTQTPPSGGGFGYPPPPLIQQGHGQG